MKNNLLMNICTNRRIVFGFFISAAIVIGILSTSIFPPFEVISDFADYDAIAIALIQEHQYIPISNEQIIYPPLYPIFLAVIYTFAGHSYTAVYIAQFLLLGGIAYFAFRISQALKLPPIYCLLGGLSVLLWPYLVLYSLLISSEILYIFFLTWSTAVLTESFGNPSSRKIILAGVLMAVATLVRPVSLLLPFWIFSGVAILLLWRNKNRIMLFPWLARVAWPGIVAFVIMLIPWILFASITFGTFIPVASNFKYVFEKGNKTLGYLNDSPNQLENSTSWSDLTRAKLVNIYLFWNPGASGYQSEKFTESVPGAPVAIMLYKLTFFCMIIFSIVAIATTRTLPVAALTIIIIYFWSIHTVLFPFPRYTLPIIPYTLILAWEGLKNGGALIRARYIPT